MEQLERWQGITYFLDGYFPAFFVLTVVAMFVTAVSSWLAIAKIERQAGGTDWRKSIHKRMSDVNKGPTVEELRAASFAWLVPVQSIAVTAVVVTIAYALLSPTICLHVVKCAEPIGFLQPDSSCENLPSAR